METLSTNFASLTSLAEDQNNTWAIAALNQYLLGITLLLYLTILIFKTIQQPSHFVANVFSSIWFPLVAYLLIVFFMVIASSMG